MVSGTEQPARTFHVSVEGGNLREADQPSNDARSIIEALNVAPDAQTSLIQNFRPLVFPVVMLGVKCSRDEKTSDHPAVLGPLKEGPQFHEKSAGLFLYLPVSA